MQYNLGDIVIYTDINGFSRKYKIIAFIAKSDLPVRLLVLYDLSTNDNTNDKCDNAYGNYAEIVPENSSFLYPGFYFDQIDDIID